MTNPDMDRLIRMAALRDDEKPSDDSPMSPRGKAAAGVAAHKAATEAQIANLNHQIAGLDLQRQLLEHQLGDVAHGIEVRRAAIEKVTAEHHQYRIAMGLLSEDTPDRGTARDTTQPPTSPSSDGRWPRPADPSPDNL